MLVECPECKKMISDQAVSCPNCGYVLHEIEPPYYDPEPANEGCFMQTMNVGCLAVLLLPLFWRYVYCVWHSTNYLLRMDGSIC